MAVCLIGFMFYDVKDHDEALVKNYTYLEVTFAPTLPCKYLPTIISFANVCL